MRSAPAKRTSSKARRCSVALIVLSLLGSVMFASGTAAGQTVMRNRSGIQQWDQTG